MGYYCTCGDYFPTSKLDFYLNPDGDGERELRRAKRRLRRISKAKHKPKVRM